MLLTYGYTIDDLKAVFDLQRQLIKQLTQVSQALADYHQAMQQRKNGNVAANDFAMRCEVILDQPYSQDTAPTYRTAVEHPNG